MLSQRWNFFKAKKNITSLFKLFIASRTTDQYPKEPASGQKKNGRMCCVLLDNNSESYSLAGIIIIIIVKHETAIFFLLRKLLPVATERSSVCQTWGSAHRGNTTRTES